jgi:hypothetical protein
MNEEEKRKKQIIAKQIRLQDEIDHNADMGYLPPTDKIKKLKEYENETGIIIRDPSKYGIINGNCPPGFVFVSSFHKKDGTFIRDFCRKRDVDLEIPARYAYRRK